MKEIEPRWKYDCFHCKFSWQCGPCCQCNSREQRHTEVCCYSALRIDNRRDDLVYRNGRMEIKCEQGLRNRVIQVDCPGDPVLSVGQIIKYRLRGRPWEFGKIVAIKDACDKKASYNSTKHDDYPYILNIVKG